MVVLKAVAVWFAILVLAFLNGLLREAVLLQSFERSVAFTLSGVILIIGILATSIMSIRWVGRFTFPQSLALGLLWLALTVAFEFGFGLLRGNSLETLLDAYRFRDGNIWPIVLAAILLAPAIGRFVLSPYFYMAAGFALVTSATAWRGAHGWGVPLIFAAIAGILLVLPLAGSRRREFVQVDDMGVAVQTPKGVESVTWSELKRVRILTTDEGPWSQDVYYLLEADGKGCAVPHDAAVRTRLLEALQSRLQGVRDDQIIEAMGSTTQNSFTIWERHCAAGKSQQRGSEQWRM